MPPTKAFFSTPLEAESAFYDALEHSDLEGLMAVWAEDEEVVCIHPGGPRLTGLMNIRESWDQVIKSVKHLSIQRTAQIYHQGPILAVHSVVQYVTVIDDKRGLPPIVATNVWRKSTDGWRLLVHHASPMPTSSGEEASVDLRVLH